MGGLRTVGPLPPQVTPPSPKGGAAASPAKGILKNPGQAGSQPASGARRPVTPPRGPVKSVASSVRATPKSPPPKKDHAIGLESTSSNTEVEEEQEDMMSRSSGRRTPSRRRSRTPLARRPKGQKQRAKFARDAERKERENTEPKVHFQTDAKEKEDAPSSRGGGRASNSQEEAGKGKSKTKKGKGKKGKGKGKGKKGHKSWSKGSGKSGGKK